MINGDGCDVSGFIVGLYALCAALVNVVECNVVDLVVKRFVVEGIGVGLLVTAYVGSSVPDSSKHK